MLSGSALDPVAKMEIISLVTGFALMCGGMLAALDEERMQTGVSAQQQNTAPRSALVKAT